MSYTPIGDFARGFSHLLNPHLRSIVTLKAYFDDSGTHAGSKVVVWAGFMGSTEEWIAFEEKWAALLKREGLKSFHMVDFENGRGECADPIAWPLVRRELVVADFRRVICSCNLIGIGATVRVDGWDAVPDEALRTRYLKPAYLAFEHTIQQAIHWSQRATEQQTRVIEKVAFFFDSIVSRRVV